MSCIVLLTGERGIGKSSVCRETLALAQGAGYTCGGIITLADAGGRDVLDVRSGDVRRLTQSEDTAHAVAQGRFRFDPDVLTWANAKLIQATPCDLVIIDEVGPLELERGGGWVNAFDVLERMDYALALVVVRPELVVQVQLQLPSCATLVMAVTQETRDQLPDALVTMLGEAG
jgi:nucleoside-triphosphatase THEP1